MMMLMFRTMGYNADYDDQMIRSMLIMLMLQKVKFSCLALVFSGDILNFAANSKLRRGCIRTAMVQTAP